MVADIVDIVGLFLAVLLAGEDAADVGLALGAGAKAGGVRQQSLEELDGHDLLPVEVDRGGGQHAHILQTAHVVEVALAEGHEEADALGLRDVLGQRLDLLVVEQVHVLFAHLIEVVLPLDAHGRDLDPVAVLPVAAGGRDLAQVDLRVEVGGEGVAVVAAVAVEDVDGVDGVELVLLGVGAVSLGHTRIEATAQQRGQAGFLKLFGIGPLPAVIEVGRETGLLAALLVDGAPLGVVGVLRLVVGGVHVVDAAGKAGVHDGQVLIGQGDVHHQVRLVGLDEGNDLFGLVGVHLGGGDLGGGLGGQLGGQLVTLCLGAAGDADLGEHFGHLAALVDGNGGHAAAADDQNFAHSSYSFICKTVGSYLYLKAGPALVQGNEGLPEHLAGRGGRHPGGVQRGGQLVEVGRDDIGLGHGADGVQQLQKVDAAGLRGAGAGEAGGVQTVEVDGQVDRGLAGTELLGQFGKAGEVELVHLGVLGCKLELGAVTAADAELMDVPVADQLVAAAEDTGMAEPGTEVVVPQVGVCVEVDDVQVRVLLHGGPHGPQRDQMFAAQQERELAVLQDLFGAGFDVGQRRFAGAKAKLQVAAVENVEVGQVGVLIGAVSLQTIALVPDGGRAEPGTGAVAGGGIIRRTVQHDAGGAVAAVAADKGFNVGVKHQCSSTSRSISSRKAGR